MPMIVGIDEAGYSPRLGPLTVCATVFDAPFDPQRTCLWRVLGNAVAKKAAGAEGPVIVADSKALYHGRGDLERLETGVLAFLRVAGDEPDTLEGLLRQLSGSCCESLMTAPWYATLDDRIPVAASADRVRACATALGRALDEAGVRFLGLRSRVLGARELNDATTRANKAAVLFGLIVDLVRDVRREFGRPHTTVLCDRLGGRHYYEGPLGAHFPMTAMETLRQGPRLSRYRMWLDDGEIDVSFIVQGDRAHLPIALASMTSKYVRELLLRPFNRFWAAHVPGLGWTSGYHRDAVGFIQAIEPAAQALQIGPDNLVRML